MSNSNYITKNVILKNGNETTYYYQLINNKKKRISKNTYLERNSNNIEVKNSNVPSNNNSKFKKLLLFTFNNNNIIDLNYYIGSKKISLFYDNNIDNFNKNYSINSVIPIKVDESENINIKMYNSYYKNSSNDVKLLFKKLRSSGFERDKIDLKSGISNNQIIKLCNFIQKNYKNIENIIFDWDRTFTIIEGLYNFKNLKEFTNMVFSNNSINKQLIICKYYLGGEVRMNNLKKLFSLLNKHYINLYILTNNGIAVDNSQIMKDIIKLLDYDIPIKNILYNNYTKTDKYDVIKNNFKNYNIKHIRNVKPIIINALT